MIHKLNIPLQLFLHAAFGVSLLKRMEDLAKIVGPIGDLFRLSDDGVRISNQQVENFHRDGFITGVRLLKPPQVHALCGAISELMAAGLEEDPRFYEYNRNESIDPTKTLFHALGGWRVAEALHDLVFFPTLATIAERLLGTRVRLWHDQVFVKPARHGGVVAWHQDYSYWTRTKPVAHVTCWIALDDANTENGCLHYVPGSHKWPLLPREALSGEMESVLDCLAPEFRDAFEPVPIELEAGSATFHHPMLLHGSYENRSKHPRRGAVVNFMSDSVVSDTNEPLLKGVPVVPRGQKIDGQFFPLLEGEIK